MITAGDIKYKGRNVSLALVCHIIFYIVERNDKSEHITHLDNVVRIIMVWSG